MKQHEAAQLVRQTHQGTLAGLDPTCPSVESSMEAIWETFCVWAIHVSSTHHKE